jgi:hypothetical protein
MLKLTLTGDSYKPTVTQNPLPHLEFIAEPDVGYASVHTQPFYTSGFGQFELDTSCQIPLTGYKIM